MKVSDLHEKLLVPPQDLESERCVIASLLLAGDDIALRSELRNSLQPSHFHSPDNRIIWRCVCEILDSGRPIDAIILVAELRARAKLDDVGGLAYVGSLFECVPSAAHGPHYAATVRNCSIGRSVLAIATIAIARVHNPGQSTYADIQRSAVEDLSNLATGENSQEIVSLTEAAMQVVEGLGNKANRFVCTGFMELDEMIGGLPLSGFTLIGAPPGMGKSAIAKQIILNVAGPVIPCGIISLEEHRSKIAANALANLSGVDNHKIVFDRLTKEDTDQLALTLNHIAAKNVFIADTCRTISQIEAAASMLAERHGCKVVFVDHLHLIDGETSQNRTQEVSKISGALKMIGKKIGVAMVGLCQLNRGETNEGSKQAPTLRRFKDSGSLEADGDVIIGLHRPDYFAKDYDQLTGELQVHVLKNKNGATGRVPLFWDGNRQRITNWTGTSV